MSNPVLLAADTLTYDLGAIVISLATNAAMIWIALGYGREYKEKRNAERLAAHEMHESPAPFDDSDSTSPQK
ncbi:MAG TPA: hypothetical protein VHV55_26550 [Pirellulales bacterium]|jgi:hypothetical protein|nr:hypothetical protein [Pirellulales bacterium]